MGPPGRAVTPGTLTLGLTAEGLTLITPCMHGAVRLAAAVGRATAEAAKPQDTAPTIANDEVNDDRTRVLVMNEGQLSQKSRGENFTLWDFISLASSARFVHLSLEIGGHVTLDLPPSQSKQ